MTRSFTAILLSFQRLALQFVGDHQFSDALDELPHKGQVWLDANARKIQQFAAKRKFDDYVFLGQGVHYWLAQEAGLKLRKCPRPMRRSITRWNSVMARGPLPGQTR